MVFCNPFSFPQIHFQHGLVVFFLSHLVILSQCFTVLSRLWATLFFQQWLVQQTMVSEHCNNNGAWTDLYYSLVEFLMAFRTHLAFLFSLHTFFPPSSLLFTQSHSLFLSIPSYQWLLPRSYAYTFVDLFICVYLRSNSIFHVKYSILFVYYCIIYLLHNFPCRSVLWMGCDVLE